MTENKDNTQPIVVTLKKEQTLEQAIRLSKAEHSNPLELIESEKASFQQEKIIETEREKDK